MDPLIRSLYDAAAMPQCPGCSGDHDSRYSCIQCGAKMCADCVGYRHEEHCAEWCEECIKAERARADLHARIDADIAEGLVRPPRPSGGVIHFPAAMLDAFGLEELDG